MVYKRFVEIGRVGFVAYGPDEGKLCVIADIIDQNRALVDGPCSGVARKQMSFKQMHLTNFVIKIGPSARTGSVKKAWEKAEVEKKWAETTWAKKLDQRQKRANVTDFERFKLMKAKQRRNRLVNIQFGKMKNERAGRKPTKKPRQPKKK